MLDNVQFDNLNPEVGRGLGVRDVQPRARATVNFGDVLGRGRGVTVNDGHRDGTIAPKECKFPKLPAPQAPAGWQH